MRLIKYKTLHIYEDNNLYSIDWYSGRRLPLEDHLEWIDINQLDSEIDGIRYTDPFDYKKGDIFLFMIINKRKEKIIKLNENTPY